MVRLPFIGAVFSPDGELFPKYSAGQYTLQDSVLVVSRGVGIGSRGFRVLNRPELVLITLKTA
jgi:predicted MPP superfamily phosphohydrolase